MLRHIAGLVKGGVIVCGPRPDGSDSLKDKAESEEYRALVDELWGELTTVSQIRKVGKGKIYENIPLSEVLKYENIRPDIAIKVVIQRRISLFCPSSFIGCRCVFFE